MPVGVSAYVPLATKTLTVAAASVTFSSISQAYRDLILVCNGKKVTTQANVYSFQFNADATSTYSFVTMEGTGSITSSGQSTTTQLSSAWNYSSMDNLDGSSCILNLMDYSTTDKHKSVLIRAGSPTQAVSSVAGRWVNTVAVNSITVKIGNGNSYNIGSTFTLYGVSA